MEGPKSKVSDRSDVLSFHNTAPLQVRNGANRKKLQEKISSKSSGRDLSSWRSKSSKSVALDFKGQERRSSNLHRNLRDGKSSEDKANTREGPEPSRKQRESWHKASGQQLDSGRLHFKIPMRMTLKNASRSELLRAGESTLQEGSGAAIGIRSRTYGYIHEKKRERKHNISKNLKIGQIHNIKYTDVHSTLKTDKKLHDKLQPRGGMNTYLRTVKTSIT
ncbi:hypothetical protein NPIL_293221 [Nephila pilipes]|uniref:Uncharacterized protein n=1 Tax=Nephila pilipes TaxID=299642 RepID=A0A8X6PCI0_NEPPI|nr:hypothetical protein NPIL_293221 [Nephila pilipes]